MSLAAILEDIRETSRSEREKGDRFERLILAFLKTEPAYVRRFQRVWLWANWPGNQGRPDNGIDLVAQHREGDGYTAIQCKFYGSDQVLDKHDIDSFFTESGRPLFVDRIIVSTTSRWSRNAEQALLNQEKPVVRLGLNSLEESTIEWSVAEELEHFILKSRAKRTRLRHQERAVEEVIRGFQSSSRGKLIMACGTGKTYTSQCIAEDLLPNGGLVLVVAPSISLISQNLKEWTAHAARPLRVFAVCSDSRAGRRADSEDISPYDLQFPATTDPQDLKAAIDRRSAGELTVVFSTYQSLPVISEVQRLGVSEFDLVICDEAHRTTGVRLAGNEDTVFTQIHDDRYVRSKRRLYMTATPRVFSDGAQAKASAVDAWVASMDDESIYGPEFFRLGFHEAVTKGLLTDYKVLVLAVDEAKIARTFQQQLSNSDNEMQLDDATRIVGCLNALVMRNSSDAMSQSPQPMQRAVAFSNTIANSKKFTSLFGEVANLYRRSIAQTLEIEVDVKHVDGSFNSLERENLLRWLKQDKESTNCSVLSNARCLTEGVDVPALDAIIFLEPRNSMVDVVQAVGRVMRLSADKKLGYVILPIGIPSGVAPEVALSDNRRFAAVWQVLNALRSHDERMNAVINQLELNDKPPEMIEIVPIGFDDDATEVSPNEAQLRLEYPVDELRDALFAKLVEKVGTRHYWEDWAANITRIAERHRSRMQAIVESTGSEVGQEFEKFVGGLRSVLNEGITESDALSMLSQHLITKPVFEVLFADFQFAASNPVSRAMQSMLDILEQYSLENEQEALSKFYEDVKLRVEGIDNASGKQRVITELYERFFSKAFPGLADALGIVYTPIELVDYVLYAVNDVLEHHFNGLSIGDEGVHVLDPFTGTGTFIARLLQIGLISEDRLLNKYKGELHANEILLLAYYIAAINIESTFSDVLHKEKAETQYHPFEGIVLTDTFHLGEVGEGSGRADYFPVNNERAERQKRLRIRVIIGNPPYSVGQDSQNAQTLKVEYENLDSRISQTYAASSSAKLKRNLYDSYVRAFRWASDQIIKEPDGGVVAFITNGGFLEANAFDGFRKTLVNEFDEIYCYNLRGNRRTTGEKLAKEGGGVFGQGSRATIAITVLVRKPGAKRRANIHYRDVGDFLSREDKLAKLASEAQRNSFLSAQWNHITPNAGGDWVQQRSLGFNRFIPLVDKDDLDSKEKVFQIHSIGLHTARDSWNINSSLDIVKRNARRAIEFFNAELDRVHPLVATQKGTRKDRTQWVKNAVDLDPKKFSWVLKDFERIVSGRPMSESLLRYGIGMYRPFFKQFMNFSTELNQSTGRLSAIFPDDTADNLAICVSDKSGHAPFSVLMVREAVSYNFMGAGNPTYLIPRLRYETNEQTSDSLFDSTGGLPQSNVSPWAVKHFSEKLGTSVSEDDIFFYTYAALNCNLYRERFEPDLKRVEPRIPLPENRQDFSQIVLIGRKLSDLHINYEDAPIYPGLEYEIGSNSSSPSRTNYEVEKMFFEKSSAKSVLVVNRGIKILNIPEATFDFIVGSRSALEWILDRYQVSANKDSGIVNDPNEWSKVDGDERYIVDLVGRIVSVSLQTLTLRAELDELFGKFLTHAD